MKRFLKIVLFVAVLLYGLNLALDDAVSSRLRHSPDRRYISWNAIINEHLNADLLIMGNSRAFVQYDPAILDSILGLNCYNLGIDGSCFNRQYMKYNIYSHYQQQPPQIIVLNIDYFTNEEWTIGHEREQFFPYLWYPYARREIARCEPLSWAEMYLPIYRYTTYKGLFNLYREVPWNPGTYRGYEGQNRPWDPTAYNELSSYHFSVDSRSMAFFRQFLKDRKVEGIQLVFCYAPIYIGLTEKVDNLSEFYACYQQLADSFDIPILDYNYSSLSQDSAYFYNAMHLNRQGAELFTQQLAHDLDSLILIRY